MSRYKGNIWMSLALAFALAISCASPGPITGGEKDTDPPRLVSSEPVNKTLNFVGNEVVVKFDEFLKPGSYSSEVFVSPFMKEKPVVTTMGKKIRIRFKEDLRPSTTYVVTLGTGIKDANEGNSLDKPIVIAFSTGSSIDSMMVGGNIVDALTLEPQPDVTILLYPEDSVPEDSFMNKRPMYVAQTDASGKYNLAYLSRRNYRVYAVKDGDRNFLYNQKSEKIGLAEDPLVVFSDTINYLKKDLQLFLPDEEAPIPRSAKWVNNRTIRIDFKEEIRKVFDTDSLRVYLSDTLGGEEEELKYYAPLIGKEKGMYFFYTLPKEDRPSRIRFVNLMDTLGNRRDTSINLLPTATINDYKDKFVVNFTWDEGLMKARFNTTYPIRPFQQGRPLDITDTLNGKVYNPKIRLLEYLMELTLEGNVPGDEAELQLNLYESLEFRNGVNPDSVITFPLKWDDIVESGTLAGTWKVEDNPGNWVIFLKNSSGKTIRTVNGKTFRFERLAPGNYSFWAFDDADGNGYWTPGSLHPYQLPEKIFMEGDVPEIRAKWEMEDYELLIKKEFKKVSYKGGSDKNGKGGKGEAGGRGGAPPAGGKPPVRGSNTP